MTIAFAHVRARFAKPGAEVSRKAAIFVVLAVID